MSSQPAGGELELRVLATVAPEGSSTSVLALGVEQTAADIAVAVSRLAEAGLIHADGDLVTLTDTGRLAAEQLRSSWPPMVSGSMSTVDFGEVTRLVASFWPATSQRDAAAEAARDRLLAGDADRDSALARLSEAFSQGRLSTTEHDQRTSKALAARTFGELDDVLEGLGGLPRQVASHPVRKVVFFTVALLSSPLVLLGGMLFLFGSDFGDHVGGLFFLVLLLPGLFALLRWAWPRH